MSSTPERTGVDAASRWPLLLLLASAVSWLVVAGVLSLLAALQLREPAFMAGCPVLTYGHTAAIAETAFVYGWLANAGLALGLWVLGRLSGEPLRAQNWALAGCAFWNIGVTMAIVGIAAGDTTGFELLQLPGYVQPLMLFSYGAVAVSGILAWSGRLRRTPFVSHWYAAAALFTLPWVLSVAHVMLFRAPARGVMQEVVAAWFEQSAWWIWIAPLALSAAYYVVPKVTGKALYAYDYALVGFLSVLIVGGLTAGRHLVGGPFPAWLDSVAVVSGCLLFGHAIIVLLNLRLAFTGRGIALKFIAFGLLCYALLVIVDAATSFTGVAGQAGLTFLHEAQKQLALYGAATALFYGAIYYAVPRITGRAWLSGLLVRAHLFLAILGIVALVACLVLAACAQGRGLAQASVPFSQITASTRPWLAGACAAQAILLLANFLLAVNFFGTACELSKIAPKAEFADAAGSAAS
ncbi:MAG TPA: cbb3-type cytochrome c oxidase subunit I [Opitutaceae bacterium]